MGRWGARRPVEAHPEGSAPRAGGNLLLVVCKGDRRVELLDADTLEPAASIALAGDTGHEIGARAGTPHAYVPIYGTGVVGALGGTGNGIDVFDVPSRVRTPTLPVPRSSYPHHVVVRRDGSLVVTAEGRASLLLVAPHSGRVHDIPLPHGQGHMVAVSAGGDTAWTAHVRPGYVVEVDLRRRHAGRSLRVADEINRISLAPDEKTAFVADQTSPRIACVDLSTMTVRAWMDVPGTAFGTAPTPTADTWS